LRAPNGVAGYASCSGGRESDVVRLAMVEVGLTSLVGGALGVVVAVVLRSVLLMTAPPTHRPRGRAGVALDRECPVPSHFGVPSSRRRGFRHDSSKVGVEVPVCDSAQDGDMSGYRPRIAQAAH